MKKAAVLGLDGLSWNYLNKLIRHGILTHTRHLISNKNTYVFDLECFPPSTPPSWTSIMTGVNPGKHGIFAFDFIDYATLEHRLFNAMHLEHPRIHEMLSMLKIPSIVINPIPGYPLIPAKSSKIISYTIIVPKTQYYPRNEIMKKYAEKINSALELKHRKTDETDECKRTLLASVNLVEAVFEIVEDIINLYEWNLLWINLQIPDIILHKCNFQIFTKVLNIEHRLFKRIDNLARMLNELSDIFVIVSDHGFSTYNRLVRINDILAKKSYVKTTKKPTARALKEYKEIKLEILGKSIKEESYNQYGYVDKEKSIAFYISKWNLGIYVKAIEAIAKIRKILSSTEGIKWVKSREEVYSGPYVKRAPHLIIRPDYEGGFLQSDNKVIGKMYEEGEFKDHHPSGVLIVKTKDLRLKDKIKIPNYTVTPLIMLTLNLPLPKTTDATKELMNIISGKQVKIKFKNYLPEWKIMKSMIKYLRYR